MPRSIVEFDETDVAVISQAVRGAARAKNQISPMAHLPSFGEGYCRINEDYFQGWHAPSQFDQFLVEWESEIGRRGKCH